MQQAGVLQPATVKNRLAYLRAACRWAWTPKVAYLARRWPPTCSPRTAHKRLTAAAQATGFPDLHFHDLRRSAASEMVNAGVDLYSVGTVLRHKAAASTKRYAHLANDTLAKALGKIGSKP